MRKSFFLAYVAMLLASCSTQTLVPQFALTAVSNGYGTDTENIVNSTIARTQTKRVIGGEIYQYEEEIEVYSHDEVTHEYTCDEFQIKWMIDRTRLNFDLLNTSHLIMDSVLFHYLFIEHHCMIDNVAKNTFWSTEDC